jgi:hypothetical protein
MKLDPAIWECSACISASAEAAQHPERASLARDLGERRDDLGRRSVWIETQVETAAPALDDRRRERGLGNPLTALEREARAIDGR